MVVLTVPTAYDELINYLAEKATPDEILAFRVSDAAQERAELLLERDSAGTLTADESLELSQMLHFDRLVSVLKASAIERINRS